MIIEEDLPVNLNKLYGASMLTAVPVTPEIREALEARVKNPELVYVAREVFSSGVETLNVCYRENLPPGKPNVPNPPNPTRVWVTVTKDPR